MFDDDAFQRSKQITTTKAEKLLKLREILIMSTDYS